MGRRDIQFYDMYKREKPPSDVENLQAKGFPLDGILKGRYTDAATGEQIEIDEEEDEEPIYGDIEVDDFNKLFRNQNLIRERYGKSIKVRLEINSNDLEEQSAAEVTRRVTEDLSRVVCESQTAAGAQGGGYLEDGGDEEDINERSMMVYSQAALSSCPSVHNNEATEGGGQEDEVMIGPAKEFSLETLQVDSKLKTIFLQLRNLMSTFNKSKEEICDLFCRCSG